MAGFMEKFVKDNPIPQETIEHFSSIPWTSKYLNDPTYKPIPTFSRVLKPNGEDYYFSRTISTELTIPQYLTLQLRDLKTTPVSPRGTINNNVPPAKRPTDIAELPHTISLLNLGASGLDGHPGVAHGGVLCAIMDETMGLMVLLHYFLATADRPREEFLFTVNLNVSYRAPVPTPGDVVVKTWLTGKEGRKWYSKGQILDKNGQVLTEAEAIWVLAKSKL